MFFKSKIKNSKLLSKSSFTLIETLIVVGIIALMVSASVLELSNFKSRRNFDLDAEKIVEAIKNAQVKATQQESGDDWGIRFNNVSGGSQTYEIFKGSSYSDTKVISSQGLSNASLYTNPSAGESFWMAFEKRTGKTLSGIAYAVTIKQKSGSGIYVISVNSLGKVTKSLENGLVGYWTFDEGTGSALAYDSSGYGNNATWNGTGGHYQQGKIGDAALFNGSSDYLTVTQSQLTNSTFCSWILSTSPATLANMVGGSGIITYPAISGTFRNYDGVAWRTSTTTISQSVWYHVCMSFAGGTKDLKLYVNGSQEYSGIGLSTYTSGQLRTIGRYYASAVRYWIGMIDDLKIYNRVLSGTEIQNLYNSY